MFENNNGKIKKNKKNENKRNEKKREKSYFLLLIYSNIIYTERERIVIKSITLLNANIIG